MLGRRVTVRFRRASVPSARLFPFLRCFPLCCGSRAPNDDAIALCAAVRPPFLGCASSAVRACGRGALRVETVCLFPLLLPRRAPFAILWRSASAVNGKMNALGRR